jgi:hypothetical protein
MERLIKLIIPSIFFLGGSIVLLLINLREFINILGILSALTQMTMFVYWLFEDNKQDQILENTIKSQADLKETKQLTKEIKIYQDKKEGILLKREKILATLIKGGAIPNKEINKIIKSVRKKGIFLVSTLGGREFKLKSVLKVIGKEKPISLVPSVLKKFGFKRVYFNDTLFIILKEDLPKKLRESEILKEAIYNELLNKWKYIQDLIIKKDIKVHKKWVEGSGFNCNICVVDIEEGEIGVLYKRLQSSDMYRDNFSEEFKSLLLGHSGKRDIGKIVKDKIKAKEILDKMSLGFLFINLPEKISSPLIKNEIKITRELNINKFVDISNISDRELEEVLSKYLSEEISKEDVKKIVNKLMKEVGDYVSVARELNLF